MSTLPEAKIKLPDHWLNDLQGDMRDAEYGLFVDWWFSLPKRKQANMVNDPLWAVMFSCFTHYNPDFIGMGRFIFSYDEKEAKKILGDTKPMEALKLDPNTPWDEIKKTYRKLVLKYHPDLNDDEEWAKKKMQELNAAFSLLKKRHEA